MTLIEKLNWRYASKQMSGEKLPQEKVDTILEAIRLAPTSMGLQPFKVLIVEDQATKQKIFETAAPGQPQIPNASELLIFACYRKITKCFDANGLFKFYRLFSIFNYGSKRGSSYSIT